MRLILRWTVLVLVVAGLTYGLFGQTWAVKDLSAEEEKGAEVNGLEFIDGATVDRYILHKGTLANGQSLKPKFAQVEECTT